MTAISKPPGLQSLSRAFENIAYRFTNHLSGISSGRKGGVV